MFKRKQPIVYLAGAIEGTNDFGLGWRLEYRKQLDLIGIKCLIPNFEEQEIIEDLESFKMSKKYNLYSYIENMRKIIKYDLKLIDRSDFIITKWNGEMSTGTFGEAQYVFLKKKQNYLITNYNFSDVPGWFLACCTGLFHQDNDLFRFLQFEYKR